MKKILSPRFYLRKGLNYWGGEKFLLKVRFSVKLPLSVNQQWSNYLLKDQIVLKRVFHLKENFI